jgi:hypothetical protein
MCSSSYWELLNDLLSNGFEVDLIFSGKGVWGRLWNAIEDVMRLAVLGIEEFGIVEYKYTWRWGKGE